MIIPSRSILFSLTGALFGLLLLLPIIPKNTKEIKPAPYAALINAFKQPAEPTTPDPLLTAEAAIIYDPLKQSVLFQKHADRPQGIASLTKIMTALVAIERVGTRDVIKISKYAILTEGAEGDLVVGEHLTLSNLIAIMMAESSNDAAVAIAEHIGMLLGANTLEESQILFVRLMNEKAYQLGLLNTYFQNPTGLDLNEEAGIISNTSSALDLARLVTYSMRYPVLWNFAANTEEVIVSEEGIAHNISGTHILLNKEPGIQGGKTGFTNTAGGSLITIAEAPFGNLSVIVVLTSSREDRFADTQKLITWLRNP